MPSSKIAEQMVAAARDLRVAVDRLKFGLPVAHVYNPLDYAWAAHEAYLRKYAGNCKRIVFLGMNPGPFGMAQTGVPFGEVAAVRNWLKITASVGKPANEHPKRPVTGFACQRSEVSGRRLWEFFTQHFGSAEKFFVDHFVANYCPLAFLESTGRNLTPDKLPAAERNALFAACDRHLQSVIASMQPEWLVAIGDFAARRALLAFPGGEPKIAKILHPSPACPAANQGWSRTALHQLKTVGLWAE